MYLLEFTLGSGGRGQFFLTVNSLRKTERRIFLVGWVSFFLPLIYLSLSTTKNHFVDCFSRLSIHFCEKIRGDSFSWSGTVFPDFNSFL